MDGTARVAGMARRRMLAADIVRRAGAWMAAGAEIGLIAVCVSKLIGFGGAWPVILGVGVIVPGAAAAVIESVRGRSLLAGARRVDDALGLRDRLSNAIAFGDGEHADGFASLAIEDGQRAARDARPERAVPIRFGDAWRAWPAMAMAAAAIGVWAPEWDVLGLRRSREVARVSEARRAAVAASVREVAEALKPKVEEERIDRVASAEQIKALEEIERELTEGKVNPEEAAERAARATEELAQREAAKAEEQAAAAEAVRQQLESLPDAKAGESELARAIREGDLAAAAEAAKKLAGGPSGAESSAARREQAEQLDQLAKDLRALSEKREKSADGSGNLVESNGASRGSSRDRAGKEQGSDALREALEDQGMSREQAESVQQERDPHEAEKKLKEAGVHPDAARRLSERMTQERREREAEKQARDETRELADAAERAAEQMKSEGRAEEQKEGEKREGELGEGREGAQSSQAKSEARQNKEGRSSAGEKQDSASASKQNDATSKTPAESGKATSSPGEQKQSGKQERGEKDGQSGEKSDSPKSSESGDAASKPDASLKGEKEDTSSPSPSKANEKGRQPSATEKPDQQDAPNAQQQTSPGGETGTPEAGRKPQQKDGQDRGVKAGEKSPDKVEAKPSAERDAKDPNAQPDANAPGKEQSGKPTPGESTEKQGGQSGDTPQPDPSKRGNSGDSIKDLAEKLKKMADRQREAGQGQQRAEDLRRQAQEMWDKASPEQRRQMEELAREWQRQQLEPRNQQGGGVGDPNQRIGSGAGYKPGDQTATPREARPETRTEVVDARPDKPAQPSGDAPIQTVAEWLGDGTRGGGASGAASDATYREAARSAERAIDERAVPRRFDRLLERYFKRLPDRVAPGAEPAKPPEPAKDAS